MDVTYSVAGIPMTSVGLVDAAGRVAAQARTRQPLIVHLCNAYTLGLAARDPLLHRVLMRGDLNLPDGVPVAKLAPRAGHRRPVRGADLMRTVLGAPYGDLRHYFFGGRPSTLSSLTAVLRSGGSLVAGAESPPWRDLEPSELAAVAARVSASGANVVWVGLGTPRQDHVADALGQLLELPVIPVGAAFDFIAGVTPEAPRWVRGSGLEWVFRLVTEPRRLWRRYLVGNVVFVWAVATARLRDRA